LDNYLSPNTDNYLSQQLSVEILSMTGQVVRTLVDQDQPPGSYQVTWDGTDNSGSPLPGGIYFCRLTTGNRQPVTSNQQQYRKILLIR
jgi:flagellar hook assembly protein FlgD